MGARSVKLGMVLLPIIGLTTVLAADIPDARVGKTYWVNAVPTGTIAVDFFTGPDGPFGKRVTLAAGQSFIVLESATRDPKDPGYKVKADDGQLIYIEGNDFERALFNEKDYRSDGSVYLSFRQYIFAGPPDEVTGAIDQKQAAERRAAAAAKRAAAAAYAAKLSEAAADLRRSEAARMALGGVRLGMTREQARNSSWLDPVDI